jgi:predicted dehydrogenase
MSAVRCVVLAVSVLALAAPALAEVQPWDQKKVTALGEQLETATRELWDTFRLQPRPTIGQGQANSYFRLQQQLRQLRTEARSLARSLDDGAGHDETLPSFESMMQTIRIAEANARRVFTGADVRERAQTAREILNQMTPFYQADPAVLEPIQR